MGPKSFRYSGRRPYDSSGAASTEPPVSAAPTVATAAAAAAVAVGDGVRQRLCAFFVACCKPPEAIHAAGDGHQASGRAVWTQEVDVLMMLQSCPELGDLLYDHTAMLLDLLRAEVAALVQKANPAITAQSISIRLTHVPSNGAMVPTLPSTPTGRLVTACGSVVRMSTKRVVPSIVRLMCRKCRGAMEVPSSPFNRGSAVKERCGNKDCRNEELQVVGQVWMDYAECRLQQRTDVSGRLPRSLLVTLDDDLSVKCNVGQLVEVVGILHARWKSVRPNGRPVIEPAIWAINIIPVDAVRGMQTATSHARRKVAGADNAPKFNPEGFAAAFSHDKARLRALLVQSVCPQLSGLFGPKLSILLAAVGGTATVGAASAMHIRSTIHCLFVGDPSTGKSQLLQYAGSIAPRSTSTTGIGSTSAGLTVAATKENGEWVLEPGALVLSDGGVCVIDELRTVSPADRASLHEAMEQQTISVAKAGLVTKLRTVCSVVSACNPPFKKNGTAEIGVGGPLLSRFDFVFLLWDEAAEEKDDRIASHILSCSVSSLPCPVAQEDVARYVWWVRSQYAKSGGPLLTDGAADLIGHYYDAQRRRGASPSLSDAVPVTIRLLEAIVRITQAHAKLLVQPVCTEYDAAMAIFLMERSAHSLKCPLEMLGSDVYTSSRVLDDLFLDDSPECLQLQQQVLDAIIQLFTQYGAARHGGGGGSDADGHAGYGVLDGGELQCSQLLEDVTVRGASGGTAAAPPPAHRPAINTFSSSLPPGEPADHPATPGANKRARPDDGVVEARDRQLLSRSLLRLEEEIRSPSASERRVVYYSNSSESPAHSQRDALAQSQVLQRFQQPSPVREAAPPHAADICSPPPPHPVRPTPPAAPPGPKRSAEEIMRTLRFRL